MSGLYKIEYSMKKIYVLHLILLLIPVTLFADTLTVKKDGTGDYQYIQDAIDNAENGMEIIVYPGTYFENLDFKGKSITLGSTYLINPVDSLVWQTVIDGNQNGSCIMLVSGESTCRIVGFTIKNGSGTIHETFDPVGGGILLMNASTTIEHCLIQNNFAIGGGGGILVLRSNVFLIGNTIRYNQTNFYGGGLRVSTNSNLIFDDEDLNSLYLNYASLGTDLAISYSCNANHIILDTATVLNLNHYYLASTNMYSYPYDGITYEANHGIVLQENQDLFVSLEGDNTNNGLSEDEPLQTISFALLKVVSDSLQTNIIYLANGTYSPSLTGEIFPLSLKSNVNISGQNRNNTILDAEYLGGVADHPPGGSQVLLEKFTVKNGFDYNQPFPFGGVWSRGCEKITIDSLAFINCRGYHNAGFNSNSTDTTIISNSLFKNNKGMKMGDIYPNFSIEYTVLEMRSTRFIDNGPDTSDARCFPFATHGLESLDGVNGKMKGNVVNCEFSGNENFSVTNLGTTPGLHISSNSNVNVINCTFADNHAYNAPNGSAVGVYNNSSANIYNSILYGNEHNQVSILNSDPEEADTLYVHHSCIEDGIDGINYVDGANFVYYDEETNISDDPEWFGQGDFPYMLSSGSPCIDAGTLDLPEGVELPEYDLAGNPRIFGASVDMGAYEWSPVSTGEYKPVEKTKSISASPNPFDWGTKINVQYEHKGRVRLIVFNNSGQIVKELMDVQTTNGLSEIYWSGESQNGHPLPSGLYHLVLLYDDVQIESLKLIKR